MTTQLLRIVFGCSYNNVTQSAQQRHSALFFHTISGNYELSSTTSPQLQYTLYSLYRTPTGELGRFAQVNIQPCQELEASSLDSSLDLRNDTQPRGHVCCCHVRLHESTVSSDGQGSRSCFATKATRKRITSIGPPPLHRPWESSKITISCLDSSKAR